jgi:hypothetical protein
MTDTPTMGTVSRLSERALDAAVGGTSLALDAVRDQKAARRRGGRINARVAAKVERAVGETTTLPERVLFSGFRALRSRAGRSDVTGTAARSLLLLVHRPAGGAARVLERIERETAPPAARRGRRTGTATSATTGVRRAAATATRRTTTGARRAATGTRKAATGPRRGSTGRTRRTA